MTERGKRRLLWVAVTMLLLAVGLVAAPSPAATEEISGFSRSVRCSPDGKRALRSEQRICQQGDRIWAVARYGGAPVDYEVCVRLGKSRPYCSEPAQTIPGGQSVVLMSTKGFTGQITVSWHSGDTDLGTYRMRFVADPVVPPFGLSPLIVAGTHRLFGLIVRHISPELRVSASRICRRGCPLPLKLISQRSETRRYRITGPKRNATFALGDELWVQVSLPNQGRIWSRIYIGRLVRDRHGGPRDTAIRRRDPPLCAPPGLPYLTRNCNNVRSPEAGL